MKKGQAGNLRNLVLFTQLGLSVVSPILVMGALAWYLKEYRQSPTWLLVLLVVIGLVSGLCCAWKMIRLMMQAGAESDLDPPVETKSEDQNEKE